MSSTASVTVAGDRRAARSERTRQRILDAAGRCFGSRSYSKTTVEEIAATAGVSKGIVYHHFSGKDGIFELLLERTLSEWAEVTALESRLEAASVGDAISGMIRAALDYARNNPLARGLFQLDPLVLIALGSSTAVRRRVEESRARLVAAVRQGIASGELRQDLSPDRVADVVRLLMMALIDHLLHPEWMDVSDERFIDTCLEVMLRGIARGGR